MKILPVTVVLALLVSSLGAVAGRVNEYTAAPKVKVALLALPEGYRAHSIYSPAKGSSLPWSYVRRFKLENIKGLLDSPNAKVNAEKYINGKWVPMTKKEFIALLASGNVKVTQAPQFAVASFNKARKPETVLNDIGKCGSVYNAAMRESIPRRTWEKKSPDEQQRILKNPTTAKYVARCK